MILRTPDDDSTGGGGNSGGGGGQEGHKINHELRNAVLAALGVEISRDLIATLNWFGVAAAVREHRIYPRVLAWLTDGFGEISVTPGDVETACLDMQRKYADRLLAQAANAQAVLQGYVRQAAKNRRDDELDQADRRRREEAARSRSLPNGWRVFTTPEPTPEVRQPAPPEFLDWCHTAGRLVAELRQLGRNPRELPEKMARWPATYLPQLGPEPLPAVHGRPAEP